MCNRFDNDISVIDLEARKEVARVPVVREPVESMGHRVHTSIEQIDDEIDLAVILTPSRLVPQVFRDCAKKGIRRLIIESSGFTEYKGGLRSIE